MSLAPGSRGACLVLLFFATSIALPAFGQSQPVKSSFPWMNRNLSPDDRAALVVKQMTLDEKITLLHGTGHPGLGPMSPLSSGSNGGAGYVVGIPRLGIPGIQMSDAAYGVRSSGQNGRYSTALPCNLAAAASWNLGTAYEYGALIGRELRAQGFNMSLGGGVDLTREPRNGQIAIIKFEERAIVKRIYFDGEGLILRDLEHRDDILIRPSAIEVRGAIEGLTLEGCWYKLITSERLPDR